MLTSSLVLERVVRHEAEVQVASVLPPPQTPVSGAHLGRAVAMCNGENRTGNCFTAAL